MSINKSKLIEGFLDAMSLIAKDAANSAVADTTVIMQVVAVDDNKYDLSHGSVIHSGVVSVGKYQVNDFVYVTITADGTKIILNKVPDTSSDVSTTPIDVKTYVNQTRNLIPVSRMNIEIDNNASLVNIAGASIDNDQLTAYVKVHKSVRFKFKITTTTSSDFYTANDFEKCNFGFEAIFGANEVERFDVNNMRGFPWQQEDAEYEIVKTFDDVSNFNGLTELKFFVNNCPEQEDISITFSNFSLTVASPIGSITASGAQVINLSPDLTLENASDNIKLYTVVSVPQDVDNYDIQYDWQRESRTSWDSIDASQTAKTEINTIIVPAKNSRVKGICIIDEKKIDNIVDIINNNGFTVNGQQSVVQHNFTLSIGTEPFDSTVQYNWSKVDYAGVESMIAGATSSTISVNDIQVEVREEYQGHAYYNNIYIGSTQRFVIYQQIKSDLYALDLSNEMEVIAIRSHGLPIMNSANEVASTRAYINEGGTAVAPQNKITIIAPDAFMSNGTFNTDLLEIDYTVGWCELHVKALPSNDSETSSYTFTFKYKNIEKDFILKKVASEEDYSLQLPSAIVNLQNNTWGSMGFYAYQRNTAGTNRLGADKLRIYINNSETPINSSIIANAMGDIRVKFYHSYISPTQNALDTNEYNDVVVEQGNIASYTIKYGNTVSKIIISLTINEVLWDEESIDFVKDGTSFSGIEEYYAATSAKEAPEKGPNFVNGVWTPTDEDPKIDANGWAKKVADTGYSETKRYLWNISRILSSNGSATMSTIEQSSVWGQTGTAGREEIARLPYYAVNADTSGWYGATITTNATDELVIPDGWEADIADIETSQGSCIWKTEIIQYSRKGETSSQYYIYAPSLMTYIALDGNPESGVSLTTSGLVFKQKADDTVTPANIIIERNVFGNVNTTDGKWTFKWTQSADNATWSDVASSKIENNGDNVKIAASDVTESLYIKLTATHKDSGETHYDQCMLTRLVDGTKGDEAINVLWNNPLITFSADNNGIVSANTSEQSIVHLYSGLSEVSKFTLARDNGDIHDDLSVVINDKVVTITTKQDTNLGATNNTNGEIGFIITFNSKTYPVTLKWVKTTTGEAAINCYIESASGNLFEASTAGSTEITLTARIFAGATEIDAEEEYQYNWYLLSDSNTSSELKNTSGNNATGKTVTVYFSSIKNQSIYFTADTPSSAATT